MRSKCQVFSSNIQGHTPMNFESVLAMPSLKISAKLAHRWLRNPHSKLVIVLTSYGPPLLARWSKGSEHKTSLYFVIFKNDPVLGWLSGADLCTFSPPLGESLPFSAPFPLSFLPLHCPFKVSLERVKVFNGDSSPLRKWVLFVHCCSRSHLAPWNKHYPLIWSEYLELSLLSFQTATNHHSQRQRRNRHQDRTMRAPLVFPVHASWSLPETR